MATPLSTEIRKNIIYHKQNGVKNDEIAKWLRVSTRSVKRIWNTYKKEKSIEPKPQNSGRRAAFCESKMEKIRAKIREQPDITLEELKEEFHLNISISALCRKLIKRDLSFKKRRCSQRSNSALMCSGFEANGSAI
jgi:transposase